LAPFLSTTKRTSFGIVFPASRTNPARLEHEFFRYLMETSEIDFLSERFLLTSLMDQHMVRISLNISAPVSKWLRGYLRAVEEKAME